VQRDTGVEQAGGLGVPEPVGALEVHQPPGAVTDVEPAGQCSELIVEPPQWVGALAVSVHQQAEKQVLRCAG
jgi:hypothetical protein